MGRSVSVLDGEAFVFGAGAEVPAIWGDASAPLWAAGEPLMIAGPDGVGKTTILQQLVLARLGLRDELFGFPVDLCATPVLYLALDRPRQIARSLARMVRDEDRETLRDRLVVWRGPLTEDLGSDRADELHLLELATACGAGTVVVDSLKDAAVKLSDDTVGGRVNRALQIVVAAGIEVVVSHHQRKATGDNRRPNKLSDVYGSRWLTAGMGSVLMLWGEPGDLVVELTHLKQPLDVVGPLTLIHDHSAGRTVVESQPTLEDLVVATRRGGLTVADAARQLFRSDDRNAIERARRKLEKLARTDGFDRRDDDDGTARYFVTSSGEA